MRLPVYASTSQLSRFLEEKFPEELEKLLDRHQRAQKVRAPDPGSSLPSPTPPPPREKDPWPQQKSPPQPPADPHEHTELKIQLMVGVRMPIGKTFLNAHREVPEEESDGSSGIVEAGLMKETFRELDALSDSDFEARFEQPDAGTLLHEINARESANLRRDLLQAEQRLADVSPEHAQTRVPHEELENPVETTTEPPVEVQVESTVIEERHRVGAPEPQRTLYTEIRLITASTQRIGHEATPGSSACRC